MRIFLDLDTATIARQLGIEVHRRRRLSTVAGLGAAAVATALALGLTGVLGPAAARPPSTMRTVSFTLVSNHNGTATLTINPKELLDAAALQNDLQQDGIPAIVTSGSFCSSAPAPHIPQAWSTTLHAQPPTITFNAAASNTNSYACTSTPTQSPPGPGFEITIPATAGS